MTTNAAPRGAPPPATPGRLVLLGHPVSHSLSPTFQNAALDAAGVALRYEPLDVSPATLHDVLESLRAVHGAGNVTVPHKAAVARACDVLTPTAERAGAVNTFWHAVDGRRVGDNTDVSGAAVTLRTLAAERPAIGRVAVIGAGGAAAAAIIALARVWPSADIRVWARRYASSAALESRFPGLARASETLDDALRAVDLAINATPLGLRAGDLLPCAVEQLPPTAAVFDLVYGVDETAWVRGARAAGHDARDGLGMLVAQGAAAFAQWFGIAPNVARMWAAVEARTGRRERWGHAA